MSKVTVSQLADVLGVDSQKLLAQLKDAGIEATSGDDSVSNDDKKRLLAHLRASKATRPGTRLLASIAASAVPSTAEIMVAMMATLNDRNRGA